jgi:hypothetical protein
MSKIIAKTIVSSPTELPFVLMNIEELSEIVDMFLICEANVTHAGHPRSHILREHFMQHITNEKVKFVEMDLSKECLPFDGLSRTMHYNEQIIRNGFTGYIKLMPDDIVISMDADEVLFGNRVKQLTRRLRRKVLNRGSYVLRLNQVIYKLSFQWTDCDFRGPVVCCAEYYISQPNPQWRYLGFPTVRKSGTHFSWLMNPSDMVKKIMAYSHRAENEIFASEEIMKDAISNRTYPFEPDRKFTIKVDSNLNKSYYPQSLSKFRFLFSEELT